MTWNYMHYSTLPLSSTQALNLGCAIIVITKIGSREQMTIQDTECNPQGLNKI
jgi:hypothetical protein